MVRVATFIQDQDYVTELSDLLERKGQVCRTRDIDVFRFNSYKVGQVIGYPVAIIEIVDPNYPLDLLRNIAQDSLSTQVVAVDRTFHKNHGKDKVVQACKSAGASSCYFDEGDMKGLVDAVRGMLPKRLIVPWVGSFESQSAGYATGFETNFHRKRYHLRGVEDVSRAVEDVGIVRSPLIITELEPPGMLPQTRYAWQGSHGLVIKARKGEANKETPIVVMGRHTSDQNLSGGKTIDETFSEVPDVHYFNQIEGSARFVELLKTFL